MKWVIFLTLFRVHVELIPVGGVFESWGSPLLSEGLKRSLVHPHEGLLCRHVQNLWVVKTIILKSINRCFMGKAMRISLMTQTGKPSLSILYLVG